MRSAKRTVVMTMTALAIVLVAALPAAAHTTATATAGPNGTTVVTWSFSHGCDGRPTIGLRVRIPTGASAVTATDPAGWTSTVSTTAVEWTGPGIPDGTTARFTASMVLTERAGTSVVMPAVQQCTDGAELAWISDTGDASESSRPAPAIVVPVNDTTPPPTAPSTSTTTGPSTTRTVIGADAVTAKGSPTSTSGLAVFIGVCAVLVIGAGALILRQRRRQSAARNGS